MKSFRTLFTLVFAATYVACDVIPPKYREIPNGTCSPPDLASQMLMHCVDKLESNCCEPVVASLDTDYLQGQYMVPCFCSVVEELLPMSAFISVDDIVNLYFACHGIRPRTEIEQTVTFCTGDMPVGGVSAPSPPLPN